MEKGAAHLMADRKQRRGHRKELDRIQPKDMPYDLLSPKTPPPKESIYYKSIKELTP